MTDTGYQLFPDLSAEDYAALKRDIRERGVLVAVEYDDQGNILDGHHRVRAWTELAYEGAELEPYPRVIREGMTDAEKRAHVRRLNILRRHLTQEQKRDLIRDQVRETPERSNRQVATSLGVSHPTVATVRSEMEHVGDVERFTTSTDTLGRRQVLHRPPPVRHAPDPDIHDDYVDDVNQDPEPSEPAPPPKRSAAPMVDVGSLDLPSLDPTPEERTYYALARATTSWVTYDVDTVAEVALKGPYGGFNVDSIDALGDWLKALAATMRERSARSLRAVK